MGDAVNDWGRKVRLAELAQGPVRLSLRPDDAERARLARSLRLEALPKLAAEVEVRPWLDGAELLGRFQAEVTQICGVTLEPFDTALDGEIEVRVLPAGSPNAPEDSTGEVALDLEAADPPDELAGEEIDVCAYVVEHLALEIDPYPRKPGVEFDYVPEPPSDSPFAALGALKRRGG